MPWTTAVMKESAIIVMVGAILQEHLEREKERDHSERRKMEVGEDEEQLIY